MVEYVKIQQGQKGLVIFESSSESTSIDLTIDFNKTGTITPKKQSPNIASSWGGTAERKKKHRYSYLGVLNNGKKKRKDL